MPAEAPVISVTRSVTFDLYFIARIGGSGGERRDQSIRFRRAACKLQVSFRHGNVTCAQGKNRTREFQRTKRRPEQAATIHYNSVMSGAASGRRICGVRTVGDRRRLPGG